MLSLFHKETFFFLLKVKDIKIDDIKIEGILSFSFVVKEVRIESIFFFSFVVKEVRIDDTRTILERC